MKNAYSTLPVRPHEIDIAYNYRLLRRLRIALVFWLVSLVGTIIWFTNSPAF